MKTPATASWAKAAIGIDFNGDTPVVVKATRTGRSLALEHTDMAAISALPSSSAVAGALLQKESFTRWLTAPIRSAKKAEKVFPSLLDIQLPFSIEDCEYALLDTRPEPDHTGTRGLLTGARNVDIERRLASFTALGVTPHLLDQEGIALWTQSLEETPTIDGGPESRIILYQSIDRVTLAIGRYEEFLGAHTMRQLDADQIHRILKSYFPVPPASTQWFITGPDANLPAPADSPLDTLSKRWPGTMKMTREPHSFFARALATRALMPGSLRCNLRMGPFLHPALAQREARRPFHWAIALLVSGLLLCAINVAWFILVSQRMANIQHTFRSLAIEITGSPLGIPAGQEVLTSRRAIEVQTKAMEPFLAVTESPLAPMLKSVLSVAREEGLSIESLTMSRGNMVIQGLAPKWTQAESASHRLNHHGWMATLERKDSAPGEERVAFIIGLGRTHEKK